MRFMTLMALSAMSLSAAVPALAQDGMMKSDHMKMSAADSKKMKSCNAMSHDKMMKNAGCMKMMKMHPDMMKSGGMMQSGGMMKHDDMMKHN